MRKQELHPRTAAINKTQKNQSKKARTNALQWLAARFPAAFDNTICIRPLKTGIMSDIFQYADNAEEVGISKSKLREAVVIFTRRLDYLACLKAREMRIDLQGAVVGEVSEEEAEHASAKIKKRVEKSVRNARKLLASKTIAPTPSMTQQGNGYQNKPIRPSATTVSEDYMPTYPPRAVYNSQTTPSQPVRAAVVVKHKAVRQYDPNAVARLKEKLGLSRSTEEKKESVE
jgi:ProP effector